MKRIPINKMAAIVTSKSTIKPIPKNKVPYCTSCSIAVGDSLRKIKMTINGIETVFCSKECCDNYLKQT